MNKILVLGSTGFIGKSLVENITLDNVVIYKASRFYSESKYSFCFDMENIDELKKFIKNNNIDIVINCIAMSNVDECENKYDQAYFVNVDFVKSLVNIINELGVKLIHLSSNAVYSGEEPLYSESSPHSPKNIYGELKSQADQFIESSCKKYTIARIMTVYGKSLEGVRTNPSEFIVNRLKAGTKTHLVTDVYNNMLYINDLVSVIEIIIRKDLNGIYNISGDEVLSRYEFGCEIAKTLGFDSNLIIPCTSEFFGTLTKRAPNTSFDNSKITTHAELTFTKVEDSIRESYL